MIEFGVEPPATCLLDYRGVQSSFYFLLGLGFGLRQRGLSLVSWIVALVEVLRASRAHGNTVHMEP